MTSTRTLSALCLLAASATQAQSPFQPLEVVVTNEALTVTVDAPIDVNISEPLDVNVQEPLAITSDAPLDVNVQTAPPYNLANHVELFAPQADAVPCGAGGFGKGLIRRGPYGTSAFDGAYRVPEGYALIITDLSWTATYRGADGWLPGQTLHMVIDGGGADDSVPFLNSRLESSPVEITEENVVGLLGGTESFETGAVFWGGEIVCAQARTVQLFEGGGGLVTQIRGIRNVNVFGRLVPDPGAP